MSRNTRDKMISVINKKNINDENINYLYELAKGIDEHIADDLNNGRNVSIDYSKNELIDMITSLADFGMLDNVMKDCNNFYAEMFNNDPENPLLITYNSQYNDMNEENEEEIVANEVLVSNRLAKMTEAVRTILISDLSESDKRIIRRLSFNYIKKMKTDSWDFTDSSQVEFPENNAYLKNYKISKRGVKFDGNEADYNNFEDWFDNELNTVSRGKSTNLSVKDIPMFQEYSRLVYCEDLFYKAKDIAIHKCIDLAKNGNQKIKVSDASGIDDLSDETKMLIKIDLPNYNAPILAHSIKEEKNDQLPKPDPNFKYVGNPIWNFRMNQKQKEFIRKHDAIELWGNDDVWYRNNEDKLAYMKSTDNWGTTLRKKERIIEQINNNKSANTIAKGKNSALKKQKQILEKSLEQKEIDNDSKNIQ